MGKVKKDRKKIIKIDFWCRYLKGFFYYIVVVSLLIKWSECVIIFLFIVDILVIKFVNDELKCICKKDLVIWFKKNYIYNIV